MGKIIKSLAAAAISTTAAILIAASPVVAASEALITSVRADRRGEVLELRFKLRGATRYSLSRDGNRLLIDLDRARLRIPARPLFGQEIAPLSLLRAIDSPDGHSRLVVQVNGKTDYAIARRRSEILLCLAPAGRFPDLLALFIDRRSEVPESAAEGGAPEQAGTPDHHQPSSIAASAEPASNDRARAPERLVSHARIVIDPGHGGRDPGAADAARQYVEKDLALQIGLRLADALRARGASVELTREGDSYLSLPARTRLANSAGADLFVSIHLNSSPNPSAGGIETFYLSNTTDRAALRLARMENAAEGGYGASAEPNLNYILSDLRQNDKAAESAALARMIEAQTVSELDGAFRLAVDGLGSKMAPFYVLAGAQMPAVLVECGFLSNRVEAERLASAAYQEKLADGIADAAVRYLNADLAMGNL